MNVNYTVNPETIVQLEPHTTDGTRCWCKKRVDVTFDGEKVGTATIDHLGMMTATISSDTLAKQFTMGVTESLSISTKLSDTELAKVVSERTRKF